MAALNGLITLFYVSCMDLYDAMHFNPKTSTGNQYRCINMYRDDVR